jgi:hypothetical protein
MADDERLSAVDRPNRQLGVIGDLSRNREAQICLNILNIELGICVRIVEEKDDSLRRDG